ncbi:MAG TPA: hypothetical protein VNK95_21075, partial [Caldilineaceae bacterium]|nr:hypothetical protein [Caldilineaceae bacterium]
LLMGGTLVQLAGFSTLFAACAALALAAAACFWLLHHTRATPLAVAPQPMAEKLVAEKFVVERKP